MTWLCVHIWKQGNLIKTWKDQKAIFVKNIWDQTRRNKAWWWINLWSTWRRSFRIWRVKRSRERHLALRLRVILVQKSRATILYSFLKPSSKSWCVWKMEISCKDSEGVRVSRVWESDDHCSVWSLVKRFGVIFVSRIYQEGSKGVFWKLSLILVIEWVMDLETRLGS